MYGRQLCVSMRRVPRTITTTITSSRGYAGAVGDCDAHGEHDRFRLVIFNKDGTLTRFDEGWIRWASEQARKLMPLVGFDTTKLIYRSLTDFYKKSREEQSYGRSFVEPKIEEIRMAIAARLRVNLPEYPAVKDIEGSLNKAIEAPRAPLSLSVLGNTELLKPSTDLARLFSALKSRCIRIALSTSDTRENTVSDLRHLKVLGYFDALQCGDDPLSPSKSNTESLQRLCKFMQVQPYEMALVGDTPTDLRMAEQADAGLRIGVLSGITSGNELAPHAEYLLPHIGFMLPLVVNLRSSPINLKAADDHHTEEIHARPPSA